MKTFTFDMLFDGCLYFPFGRQNFLPFPTFKLGETLEEELYQLAGENFKHADTLYYKNNQPRIQPDYEPICEVPMEDLVVYATSYEYSNYYPSYEFQIILRNFKKENFYILSYGQCCLEGESCENDYYAYPLKCEFDEIKEFFEIYGAMEYVSRNRIYKIDRILEIDPD